MLYLDDKDIEQRILAEVADIHTTPTGAYNITGSRSVS